MMRKFLTLALCLGLAACGGGRDSGAGAGSGLIAEKRGFVNGPGACGVKDAYLVRAAGGVRLSQPATLTRNTAERLDTWLRTKAIRAVGSTGGGLVGIQVASHYSCRTRNNRPGAKLSEHAQGRAIDISAFILADGTRITVLDGWNNRHGPLLRRLHASACGPFGTVLGPNSDRFHRDHFHFDTASYRGGAYCR